jgi:hypothetical protein
VKELTAKVSTLADCTFGEACPLPFLHEPLETTTPPPGWRHLRNRLEFWRARRDEAIKRLDAITVELAAVR